MYDEAWLNILISWGIILIDFDTTWLYVLLSKLEYETWFMKNYDIRNTMNWQPDYVKDPANGGIYVGNWLSWGFMSPARPTTCARETSDKPPTRPAVPKDFAGRWFTAHCKKIHDIMILPQKKYGHSS